MTPPQPITSPLPPAPPGQYAPPVEGSQKSNEDLALVGKIVAGDTNAFQAIISQYKNYLFALICRQVRDRALAEDITQETFIKAYRGISSFRGDSSLKTWLTRIALNCTHSFFASRAGRERASTDAFPDDHDSAQRLLSMDHPSYHFRERMELFSHALQSLSNEYRDVIVLFGLEHQSYEEVSITLKIPVGTVKSRLNKARLLLKDALHRYEQEDI